MSECHGTAPSACTVFLRDVATSRHSPNKFGSALDLRNVINSLTTRGDWGCGAQINIAAVAEETAGMTLGDGHCVCVPGSWDEAGQTGGYA